MTMVPLDKPNDPAAVREIGWRLDKLVSWAVYRRDLAYAHEQRLNVHEQPVEGRDGTPVTITWIATPSGALLAAYWIERAHG